MQLNEKQQLAINMASDWYAKQNAPVFKMAGYAGTGKTTVATTIARTLEADDNILFCAFTGKAACVMRQKGMPGQTIHSAIYDYETVTDPQTGKKHIVHHLKPYLPYKLIVVDEASMVGKVNTFRPAAGDYADDLIEFLQDAACEECGAEDWLNDVTHADLRDLGVFLDDAFVCWLDKHPEYKPGFYTLTDLQLFDKEGEPLD